MTLQPGSRAYLRLLRRQTAGLHLTCPCKPQRVRSNLAHLTFHTYFHGHSTRAFLEQPMGTLSQWVLMTWHLGYGSRFPMSTVQDPRGIGLKLISKIVSRSFPRCGGNSPWEVICRGAATHGERRFGKGLRPTMGPLNLIGQQRTLFLVQGRRKR